MDDPLVLASLVVLAAVVVLFAIEIWTVKTGRPTISARFQALNRALSKQLVSGIFFVLGVLAGWFIAHFTT